MLNDKEITYSTFQLLKAFKGTDYALTRARLVDWMAKGFIEASIPSPGQGIPAKFNTVDVYKLGLFIYLVDRLNMRREDANTIARRMYKEFLSYFKKKSEDQGITANLAFTAKYYIQELYIFYLEGTEGSDIKQTFRFGSKFSEVGGHNKNQKELLEDIVSVIPPVLNGKKWRVFQVINVDSITNDIDAILYKFQQKEN